MHRLALAALTLVLGLTVGLAPQPAPASAPGGPDLRAATSCPPRAELRAARGVVLLVAGTGSTPDETWSWSYEPALRADGFATCTVELPDHALGSFTEAAPYVVAAIRTAARRAGGPIAVVGHSQGGALPVWAVKYWPGLAGRVTDVVSLAGPFGGTALGNELCAPGRCAPLAWQLRQGANTVAALRAAPLPAGVAVTSIASRYDEIVRPQPAASQLDGATNILLQDVCAPDPSEHGVILGDPVAYALALDALTHRGPADPARLPADTCSQTFIPHGDLAGSPVFLQAVARFATGLADPTRWVDQEPPLPAYAR
ncbi:lipase [Nocardioides aquiterrae]|uniref:Alpha/beta fold hydrolase n=1 Tax=Nocardioides aquiterrae TaxID=203799 RepID=A0ABP4EWS4_9ACTN